jgi:hypothetical protein
MSTETIQHLPQAACKPRAVNRADLELDAEEEVNGELKTLAENFRRRATAIEAKHGRLTWVQVVNVIEAFEQCAGELEEFYATLRPVPPAQTPNPA